MVARRARHLIGAGALIIVVAPPAGSRAAGPVAGLLPVQGELHVIGPDLGRALAEQGLRGVLGPDEVLSRLTARPAVASSLAAVRARLARSEEACFRMNRSLAIAEAQGALRQLGAIDGQHIVPELMARGLLALAEARLLHPADVDAADAALDAAVRLGQGLEKRFDRLPPAVTDRLVQARSRAGPPTPPTREEFGRLARLSGLRSLLWVGGRGEAAVNVVRYSASEGALHTATCRLDGNGLRSRRTTFRLAACLRSMTPSGPATPHGPFEVLSGTGKARDRSPEEEGPRPWHQRWWIWTIAGAVVVGTTIGLAVGLGRRGDNVVSPNQGFTFEVDL